MIVAMRTLKSLPGRIHGVRVMLDKETYRQRFCLLECPDCLSVREVTVSHAKSGKVKCWRCTRFRHGFHGTRVYMCWTAMRQRVNNPNHSEYKRYGDAGVSICREWDDAEPFCEWALSHGYRDSLTLDRIDPYGNYEPSNCRWATRKVQGRNTRLLGSANTSGYRGVYRYCTPNKWQASICVNGISVHIGCFSTRLEAARARDAYVIAHSLEHTLNFPGA